MVRGSAAAAAIRAISRSLNRDGTFGGAPPMTSSSAELAIATSRRQSAQAATCRSNELFWSAGQKPLSQSESAARRARHWGSSGAKQLTSVVAGGEDQETYFRIRLRSVSLARDNRDFTVPWEQPRTSAISL